MKYVCKILFFIILLLSCTSKPATYNNVYGNIIIGIYNVSTIDYNSPENYLRYSEQSYIEDVLFEQIINEIGSVDKLNLNTIKKVFLWYNDNFEMQSAGGKMIGKVTARQLIETRKIYGCHSATLVLSSILRKIGFPTVVIETASVKWARDFSQDSSGGMVGHVLTEVFVNGKWILLDTNGKYIDNYDPYDPFISTDNPEHSPAPLGLFVLRKGLDHWDYGVDSPEKTREIMLGYAHNYESVIPYLNTQNYNWKDLRNR